MNRKNEETEKTLKWRLSELPTAGEVAELVDSGVITTEEAREILFTHASSSDEKQKALEEQVEFLTDLVKTLSKNQGATFYPIQKTFHTSPLYWATTAGALNNAGYNVKTLSGTGGTGTITMSAGGSNLN